MKWSIFFLHEPNGMMPHQHYLVFMNFPRFSQSQNLKTTFFFSWKEEISMTQITAMAHFWFSLPGSWAAGSLHNRWGYGDGHRGASGSQPSMVDGTTIIHFFHEGGHQVREFWGGANFWYKQVDQNRFAQYFAAMCFYLCVCNEQLLG